MTNTLDRVPAHLRQYVAFQDYGAYDEIDQAVWRFILLQTHARLVATAHPAYARGLAGCGLSVERIPNPSQSERISVPGAFDATKNTSTAPAPSTCAGSTRPVEKK